MKTPEHYAQLLLLSIFLLIEGGVFALDTFFAYKPILAAEIVITSLAIGAALLVFCLIMRSGGKKDESPSGKRKRNIRVTIVSAVLVVATIIASVVAGDAFASSEFLQYLRAFLVIAAIAMPVCAHGGMKIGTVVALVGFIAVAVLVTMGYGDLSDSQYDTIIGGYRLSEAEEHWNAFTMIVPAVAAVEYLCFIVMSFVVVWFCAPKQR